MRPMPKPVLFTNASVFSSWMRLRMYPRRAPRPNCSSISRSANSNDFTASGTNGPEGAGSRTRSATDSSGYSARIRANSRTLSIDITAGTE